MANGNGKVSIFIDAEDNASGVINGVASGLGRLERSLSMINGALRQYNSSMSTLNHAMINIVKEAGSAIYDFTSDAISNYSELSEQHAKTLGAMANNYDGTLESQRRFLENSEKMKQQAIDLAKYGINGNGSLASSVEVSALQTELVKAGVPEESIINDNVVPTVLQFAQANQLGTDQAVEFAVSLGNQFGVDYEDWDDMLDKVSHTADLSIIDVSEIVSSMKYAGGISAGLDRPMEEILAMISTLGDFGLAGSQAGTGIQSFLTRLLTGDTTVITDAQVEVSPPKALEAFYDFSNYAKSGGSEITYDDILNETFTEKDITGELRPMNDVLDAIETTMGSLNDEEQAWFAKKLFGLYQMKSAYALINGDDSDMALSEVIKEIEDNSFGTNENKLAELINSQSGQVAVTKNLFDTIKTELGLMLEPTTLAILNEVQSLLKDPSNYDIDWGNIQSALDESCDSIEQAYGKAIADAVRNVGSITIDLGQIIEEIAPEFGKGILDVFNKLITGNILGEDGITVSWGSMIDEMDKSLEGLPDDLKLLGEKVVDVIDMFGKLAAFNTATTIAQLVASVLQIAMMTINAASVVINGSSITGGSTGSTGTGTGKGKTNQPTVLGNIGGLAGGLAGGLIGDKLGDGVGGLAGNVAKELGASDNTATTVSGVADTATTIGGVLAGGKIASWVAGGGLTAAGGGAVSAALATPLGLAIAGVGALGASAFLMADDYNKTIDGLDNRRRTIKAVQQSEDRADDVYAPGSVMTFRNKAYLAETVASSDEYKYMNGDEIGKPMKSFSNLWGKLSSYKDAYSEWEAGYGANRDQFYSVQEKHYASTGDVLKYKDYEENKDLYDAQYAISTLTNSIGTLNQKIDGMALENSNADYWSSVIGGYGIMSEKGQQQAIQNYLNSDISIAPTFTMEAPQIQVDVTLDRDGNVVDKKQSILNFGFDKKINTWYQKVASQYGATTK